MYLAGLLRKIESAIVMMSTIRGRLIAPSNQWLLDEVDVLFQTCRFFPKNEAFLLSPEVFDSIGDYRAQVTFLAKRHCLSVTDIAVYMHSDLKSGGRRCAGAAQFPYSFDTSHLGVHERLLTVNSDGSHTVLDSTDPKRPTVRLMRSPLSLSSRKAAIFLNQAYVNRHAGLAGIISHEVAHLYLYNRGVQKPALPALPRADECRTDIAMFVMGLGQIALRAAAIDKIGYLTHRQMLIVQHRTLALMSAAQQQA